MVVVGFVKCLATAGVDDGHVPRLEEVPLDTQ